MTDRPILFSGPMIRALIDGRKTQTRRVLKPTPFLDKMGNFCAPDRKGKVWIWGQHTDGSPCVRNYMAKHVHFKPGDRLWVREAWSARMVHGWTIADARSGLYQTELVYRADGAENIDGWWPSIHMPREFSRLTLVVTNVRIQRLQETSEADAVAEGCFKGKATGRVFESVASMRLGGDEWANARDWYADLWDRLNAKSGFGWDVNPWVVAISFEVKRANIDALPDGQP